MKIQSLLTGMAGSCLTLACFQAEAKSPNIVLIMTDQQRADLLAREGYPLNTMPTVDELAYKGTWFNKAYTTRAVVRLDELGYVTRQTESSDHRVTRVYLTEKGREAAQQINDIFLEWRDLISAGVSQAESEAVLDISRKLYLNAFRYYSEHEV